MTHHYHYRVFRNCFTRQEQVQVKWWKARQQAMDMDWQLLLLLLHRRRLP